MTQFFTNCKAYGNSVLYSGYENNKKVLQKVPYQPTLYVDSKKPSEFKNLSEGFVAPVEFENIKAAKEFIDNYKDIENYNIYGQTQFHYAYLSDRYKAQDIVKYDIGLIRVAFIDIEVSSPSEFPNPEEAKYPITALTLYDSKTKTYYVWGLPHTTKYKLHNTTNDIVYKEFMDERALLRDFLSYWQTNYPDIISGWNSSSFDIPYIVNRIKNMLGEKSANHLSPWNIIRSKEVTSKYNASKKDMTYDIYGISDLDYMHLYLKFTLQKEESYKLGNIAEKVLGIGKLDFEGDLYTLYTDDFQTFIEYNIRDVEILVQLDEKLKYMQLVYELTYASKCNYIDTLGTVRMWECLMASYLDNKKIYPEIKRHNNDLRSEKYAGAYVKEPIPGLYRWIVSFDATSLYPSIIRHINIGSETRVPLYDWTPEMSSLLNITEQNFVDMDYDLSILKKLNLSISANAQLYSRDKQSFYSELMEFFSNKRKEDKKEMLKNEQLYTDTKDATYKNLKELFDVKQNTKKTLINSFYGCVGNEFFWMYRKEDAEAVTLSGRVILHYIEKKANEYLNKVCGTKDVKFISYQDTDSCYFDMTRIVEKFIPNETNKTKIVDFIDRICKEKLGPKLDEWLNEFAGYTNAFENQIFFKREAIAENAIWTGKKRYCMNVYDSEGVRYKEPKMKVTGLETVKSSSPKRIRKKLEGVIKVFLSGSNNDLIKYIEDFKAEYKTLKVEEIASPRGISDVDKYYVQNGFKSKTPIHVRAAIVHNRLVQQNKVTNKYKHIQNGNKIKFVYLKEPNPTMGNVIAFQDKLPKEFELEKYIDYDTQFQKTFIEPVKAIADVIGWKLEESIDLSDLF